MGLRRATVLLLLSILIPSLLASVALQAVVYGFPMSDASANPLCISSPCAQMITGWLHTNPSSGNVYDSNGNVVRLQGVNVDGLDFGTGGSSLTSDSCGRGWKSHQLRSPMLHPGGSTSSEFQSHGRTLNLPRQHWPRTALGFIIGTRHTSTNWILW